MKHTCRKYVARFEHLVDGSEDRFQIAADASRELVNEQRTARPEGGVHVAQNGLPLLVTHDAEGDTGDDAVGGRQPELPQNLQDVRPGAVEDAQPGIIETAFTGCRLPVAEGLRRSR
jgi:hypothetical protein